MRGFATSATVVALRTVLATALLALPCPALAEGVIIPSPPLKPTIIDPWRDKPSAFGCFLPEAGKEAGLVVREKLDPLPAPKAEETRRSTP